MNKDILIFLTAYTPRWNIIASKRILGLSKYLSEKYDVYIVAGKPKKIFLEDVDLGNSKLIEIDSLYNVKRQEKKTTNIKNKFSNKFVILKKYLKLEILPFLEMLLPVSPGGLLLHNQKMIYNSVQEIIKKNYGKKRIFLFATYGPSFIIKIGNKIKQKYPKISYVVDFRDWAYKYYEGYLYNTKLYKYYTNFLIKKADGLTFVSNIMKEDYLKEFNINKPVLFLPNGHFETKNHFESKPLNYQENCEILKIVYTGSFHYKKINPSPFLEVLSELQNRYKSFKIKFIYAGKDIEFLSSLIERYKLNEIFEYRGFLDRNSTINLQKNADLLLLLAYTGEDERIGSSIITGKFYEYLFSKKPILVLAPENWEMREIVEIDGLSKIIPANKKDEILRYILKFKENLQSFNIYKREKVLDEFNYEKLAEKLDCFLKNQL